MPISRGPERQEGTVQRVAPPEGSFHGSRRGECLAVRWEAGGRQAHRMWTPQAADQPMWAKVL